MKSSRVYPWILLGIGFAGIAGIGLWNFIQQRQVAVQSHDRWVRRVSGMIVAERESLTRWVAQFPAEGDIMAEMARSNPYVDALFLVDHKEHRTLRWVRPASGPGIDKLDPRLSVLELETVQNLKTVSGPVILVEGIAHGTVVRPLDREHALIVMIRAQGISQLLESESRLWHLQTYVYDYEEHPIFISGTMGLLRPVISQVIHRARNGSTTGLVPLPREQMWEWLASFHYDPASDWIFIVVESAAWSYLPFVFFLVSVAGVLILAGLPWRAGRAMYEREVSYKLQQFATRVDSFVRGRDLVLAEPPYPHSELMPIVLNLRWLMPQWKKAEAFPRELALERKLLSLLVESLPEGILFFNAKGQLQLSNELGRAFLAHQQETGREFKMLQGVQVPRGFLEPFTEPVMTGAQKTLGKEVEVGWADGKHLYRVWVESVEASEEGSVDGFIVVVRDITFRRQWEYVQEQVLSGITHDLRGPLSAVMGYLDLMRRQVKEDQLPKVAEYIKLAREAGVRLTQMVSDILDVVRFEQGKIDLAPQAIPVREIFKRLDNLFTVTAQQKQVGIKFEGNGALDESTWGDPKLLERVFDNLVGNAIKFTPSGGTITVTAQRGRGRMLFMVTDTGRGIPREAQSRIFDKFQQVRPGDRSSGYGLGLAVVKFIVEAHKGEIRVESEVGQGSRFMFYIPDAPPDAAVGNA